MKFPAMDKMRSLLNDYLVVFRRPIKALGWVAFFVGVLSCAVMIIIGNYFSPRSPNFPEPLSFSWVMIQLGMIAKLVLVGVSTAFFTKLAGGMGMFQDAIASVLGNDAWLDRRNDLVELWKKITRKVFMPGFHHMNSDSSELLAEVNISLTNLLFQDNAIAKYYAKNSRRRLTISWNSADRDVVKIEDFVESDVVAYEPKGKFPYKINFWPSPGQSDDKHQLRIISFKVNGEDANPETRRVNGIEEFLIELDAGKPHKVSRELAHYQNINDDPIFIVTAGRIVWKSNVIVSVVSSDLKVSFEGIGGDDLFKPTNAMDKHHFIERECAGVVLPEQGFILSMIKTPQQ